MWVGPHEALAARSFGVREVSWADATPPCEPFRATVQVRHRHPGATAEITPSDGARARVDMERPERAVTPGQSAVFYDGDRLVGGGIIEAARTS